MPAAAEPQAPPAAVAPEPTSPGAPEPPPPTPAPITAEQQSGTVPPVTEPPPPIPPTPLGQPKIDVRVPEPPPAVVRRRRMHDGFYARANLGLVTAGTFVSTDRAQHPNYDVEGGGLAVDLLIGGSPSVGLATGGAVSIQSFGHGGDTGPSGLTLLGVFVDGFPQPNGGFHLGGMLGLAGVQTTRKDNRDEFEGGGLGLAAWVGHGFWVGDEWSLGGLLRLSGALARDDSREDAADPVVLSASVYEAAFLFSVLYH